MGEGRLEPAFFWCLTQAGWYQVGHKDKSGFPHGVHIIVEGRELHIVRIREFLGWRAVLAGCGKVRNVMEEVAQELSLHDDFESSMPTRDGVCTL